MKATGQPPYKPHSAAFPLLVSNAMEGEVERVKREDCSELKNGPDFSPWKILVGPSDWEDHSSGVCGAEKYRTQNLPLGCMGPGLYELGIAMTSTKGGQRVRDPNTRYVTVYLGIADNVRTRLQEYGRNGSHLDGGKSINLPDEKKGLGLFQDVFSKGFSIVFRWVPMRSKQEAEDTEAMLLKRFDYAWNRGRNGARRPHDIIPMLDKNKIISRKTRSCDTLTKCRASTLQINGRIPSEDSEAGPSHLKLLLGSQATVISRSRPQLVSRRFAVDEHYICGVMMGNGLSCANRPIEGNKRCIDHKGQRVHGTFSVCGMILEDGSTCKSSPVDGRKRCELHKGDKIEGF
ncbi:hypothetical protein ACLOJK_037886 [Asimina triloba]